MCLCSEKNSKLHFVGLFQTDPVVKLMITVLL